MSRPIKKLAIVGASARAAAFSAVRSGYEVIAADLFADADLQAVCPATRISDYPHGLADWLAATECDAWMFTGALENYPELVDRMATLRPLLGNSGEALRRARDPLAMQLILRDAELPFPETVTSRPEALQEGLWLCKTYRGASGSGVWPLDGLEAAERGERQGAVFQRFVPGLPAAALYVLQDGRSRLLGVTQQLLGDSAAAGPFQYCGSMACPLPITAKANAQLRRLGDVLAMQFELRGLVGVDLAIDGDAAWVIEINPRYTASVEIVERYTGVAAIGEHVAAFFPGAGAIGSARPVDDRSACGKRILFADRDVTISDEFHQWAMSQRSSADSFGGVADIPAAGEQIPAGRPVLTAFATSTSTDCTQMLSDQFAIVKARLYCEK